MGGWVVDFFTTLRVLLRRWYILLPCLALTVAGGWFITSSMEPVFESKASVVLLGPNVGREGEVNPYLDFGGSLETTALVLSNNLSSEPAANRLFDAGAKGTYLIVTPGGPVVNVEAKGRNEVEAIQTANVVVAALADELRVRQEQAGAPQGSFIRAELVVSPETAAFKIGSRLRVLVAVAVLGIAASLSLTFAFESVARSRSKAPAPVDRRVVELRDLNATSSSQTRGGGVLKLQPRGRQRRSTKTTTEPADAHGTIDEAEADRVLQQRPPGAWLVSLD